MATATYDRIEKHNRASNGLLIVLDSFSALRAEVHHSNAVCVSLGHHYSIPSITLSPFRRTQCSASQGIELVYNFQDKTMEKALGERAQAKKATFPHNAELIDITVAAMHDFVHSAQAVDNGLVVRELLDKELAKTGMEPENS